MTVGKRIKEVRKDRGLTQAELAEKCNMSRSYLCDVEGDRYNPSVETLKKIASTLKTNVSYLMGDNILQLEVEDNGFTEAAKLLRDRPMENVPFAKYRDELQRSGVRILLDTDAKLSESDMEDIINFIKEKQRKNGR